MSDSSVKKQPMTAIVSQVGLQSFASMLAQRASAINTVGASFVRPERLIKVVMACVTRTPILQQCTQVSIVRSMIQSAELGLEPGSMLGEAYLVPFKNKGVYECQMIVGYRGLITLAFRSGHIASVQAREVYEGDNFTWELGLEPKLVHVPKGENNADKITHAYCVVKLKDGGVIYDVMTRNEIDRIRGRSRAGQQGPWVTDYAEMAKKTVTRRTLKYAPMSIEMGKAYALDAQVDTGESADSAFDGLDIIDGEFNEDAEQPATAEPRKTGVDAVKEKMGIKPEPAAKTEGPTFDIRSHSKHALERQFPDLSAREAFAKQYLGDADVDTATTDQLAAMLDGLNDVMLNQGASEEPEGLVEELVAKAERLLKEKFRQQNTRELFCKQCIGTGDIYGASTDQLVALCDALDAYGTGK